jgi:hypothetical protein
LAFLKPYRFLLFVILASIIVIPSHSQNTKGDKPASNQGSILRIPRIKKKKKGGDKAYTGDVTGRRIRTKNKSSAVRVVQTKPLPYAKKRPSEVSRIGRPIGSRGTEVRIRSSSAQAARNNVYPNRRQFIPNASKKPHNNQQAYSNQSALAKVASWITKREPPGPKKRITPRSASSSFVTRGRKNVYWGKLKRGEKPVTTDLTGRSLRAKNFHSPGLGVIPVNEVYKRKKRPADRPYKGTYISGFATSAQRSRAWNGDLSGHAIRGSKPKNSQTAGHFFEPRKLSNSSSFGATRPIPGVYPGRGVSIFKRFLGKFRGRKYPQGGGSASKGFNNNGQPIPVRTPGLGANMGNYRGNIPGEGKAFSQQGLNFTGYKKSRRPRKGGGSITGGFNNNGQPIEGKTPGIGVNMGNFRGNIPGGGKTFSQQGLNFSGDIKSKRQPKGGGSVSGRIFDNNGRAIEVRTPGIGVNMGNFSGNIKSRRQAKGGGSISGSWNNKNKAVDVRTPGIGANYVGQYKGFFRSKDVRKEFSQDGLNYSGNIPTRKQLKGGGSISGSWNNGGRPIDVRVAAPGAGRVGTYSGFLKNYELSPGFSYQGETYKGSMKAKRQQKGGGSISGSWNNKGNPIQRRSFSPAALKIGRYAGNLKAKRPEKGGGSISGKVWNNNEQAILARTPISADAKNAGYSGRIRLPLFRKKYIRGPYSDKEALKKIRPDKNTYAVNALQLKVKQKDYARNKLSAKGALKGVSPGKNSVKASEYDGRMKMLWTYKQNPSAHDGAIKSRKPANSFMRWNDFAGRLSMKKYVHNPRSNKNALDVIAPGKAMARIRDYQGNLKMNKPNGKNLHPDSQFAHSEKGNVKGERTFLMNIKLKWAKFFKRSANQPDAVREKVRRPRYDKKEKDLWKDLYD